MAPSKSSASTAAAARGSAESGHLGVDHRLQVRIVDQGERVFLARLRDLPFGAVPVLLLEDVGGALVGGEEVGTVLGGDEVLESVHAGQKPHEVIFVPERKDRIDEVVADAGLALLDLEAVGEEAVERVGSFINQCLLAITGYLGLLA
jgi:hypothetical protein